MRSIYLIGAMQIYEDKSDETKEWRNKVKEYFSKYCLEFECISPTDYYEYGSDYHKSNREVMRFDLRKVRESDVMLINLKNIRQFVGSCDEIFYAYTLGKPIIGFIEDNLTGNKLVNYVHEWKYEQIDRIETGEDALEKACEYIKNYYYTRRNNFAEKVIYKMKDYSKEFLQKHKFRYSSYLSDYNDEIYTYKIPLISYSTFPPTKLVQTLEATKKIT